MAASHERPDVFAPRFAAIMGERSEPSLSGCVVSRSAPAAPFSLAAWPPAPGGELLAIDFERETIRGAKAVTTYRDFIRNDVTSGAPISWRASPEQPRLETRRRCGAAARKARNRPHRAESENGRNMARLEARLKNDWGQP